MGRWFKRLILAGGVLVALLAILLAISPYLMDSDSFRGWALAQAREQVRDHLRLDLDVGGIAGNPWRGVELRQVSLSHQGKLLFSARKVTARWTLTNWLTGAVRISAVEATEPYINLEGWPKDPDDDDSPPFWGLVIKNISLTGGRLDPDGRWGPVDGLDNLAARGSFRLWRRGPQLELDELSGRVPLEFWPHQAQVAGALSLDRQGLSLRRARVDTPLGQIQGQGQLTWRGDLKYQADLTAERLDLAALPGLERAPQATRAALTLSGGEDTLDLTLAAQPGQGRVEGRASLDFTHGARGRLEFRGIDLAAWGLTPEPATVEGVLPWALEGWPGREGWRLVLEKAQGTSNTTWLGQAQWDLDGWLDQTGAQVVQAGLDADWGQLEADGRVEWPGDSGGGLDLRVRSSRLGLPPVATQALPPALAHLATRGEVQLAGRWDHLTWRAQLGPGSLDQKEAWRRLEADGWLTPESPGLDTLRVEAAWGDLSARGRLDARELDTNLEGNVGDPGQLWALAAMLAPDLPPAPQGELRLAGRVWGPWTGLQARVDQGLWRGPWGRAEAKGGLDQNQARLDWSLDLEDCQGLLDQLDHLGLLPRPVTLGGALEARGRLSGPWRQPALELASLDAQGDWGHLEGSGAYDLASRRLELRADLGQASWGDLGELLSANGLYQGPPLGGSGQARVELAGVWPRLRGQAHLEGAHLEVGDQDLDQARLDLELDEDLVLDLELRQDGASLGLGVVSDWPPQADRGRLRLERVRLVPREGELWRQHGPALVTWGAQGWSLADLDLRKDNQRLTASGHLGPDQTLGGSVEVDQLDLTPWLPFTTAQQAQAGSLDAKLELGGSLASPVIHSQGSLSGLRWRNLPPSRLDWRADYQDDQLRMEGQVLVAEERRARLDLDLGLDLSLSPWRLAPGRMRARLVSHQLPLSLLRPLNDQVTDLRGNLEVDLEAQGEWPQPRLSGQVDLVDGGLTLPQVGVRLGGVNLKVGLDQDRLRVQGEDRRGLSLTGTARLPWHDAGHLDIHLTTDRWSMWLASFGRLSTALDLSLTGDFQRPALAGVIRPRGLRLRFSDKSPSTGLEDVVLIQPGDTPPPILKPETSFNLPAFLDPFTLDIKLELPPDFQPQVNEGWVKVNGKVALYKAPGGQPSFRNQVESNQGLIIIFDRRIEVINFLAAFAGKPVPNPDLGGQARLVMGGMIININVSGTAFNPQLNLSSDPPMSQTDILSVMIFGQTTENLSRSQGQALSAQALALLGTAGRMELEKIFGPDLTPDVVTVHRGTLDQYSSLEAGKYLAQDLYLRYRQSIDREGGMDVGLEYRLTRHLSLESSVGTSRDSGVDVVYSVDF